MEAFQNQKLKVKLNLSGKTSLASFRNVEAMQCLRCLHYSILSLESARMKKSLFICTIRDVIKFNHQNYLT